MPEAPVLMTSIWHWIFAGAGLALVIAWLIARYDEKDMFSQRTLENDFGPACGPAPRKPAQRQEHATVPAPLV